MKYPVFIASSKEHMKLSDKQSEPVLLYWNLNGWMVILCQTMDCPVNAVINCIKKEVLRIIILPIQAV